MIDLFLISNPQKIYWANKQNFITIAIRGTMLFIGVHDMQAKNILKYLFNILSSMNPNVSNIFWEKIFVKRVHLVFSSRNQN